jgi:hypothetical protein
MRQGLWLWLSHSALNEWLWLWRSACGATRTCQVLAPVARPSPEWCASRLAPSASPVSYGIIDHRGSRPSPIITPRTRLSHALPSPLPLAPCPLRLRFAPRAHVHYAEMGLYSRRVMCAPLTRKTKQLDSTSALGSRLSATTGTETTVVLPRVDTGYDAPGSSIPTRPTWEVKGWQRVGERIYTLSIY